MMMRGAYATYRRGVRRPVATHAQVYAADRRRRDDDRGVAPPDRHVGAERDARLRPLEHERYDRTANEPRADDAGGVPRALRLQSVDDLRRQPERGAPLPTAIEVVDPGHRTLSIGARTVDGRVLREPRLEPLEIGRASCRERV